MRIFLHSTRHLPKFATAYTPKTIAMKLTIALAMLMFCSISTFAQQAADTLCLTDEYMADGVMRRIDSELWLNGIELSPDTLQLMLSDRDFATYSGAVRQYYVGKVLRDVGFLGIGVAAISITVAQLLPVQKGTDMGSAASFWLMLLGTSNLIAAIPLVSTGIPLKLIGEARLNWLATNYNQTHSHSTWHIAPLFTPTGQVGIALRYTF